MYNGFEHVLYDSTGFDKLTAEAFERGSICKL